LTITVAPLADARATIAVATSRKSRPARSFARICRSFAPPARHAEA